MATVDGDAREKIRRGVEALAERCDPRTFNVNKSEAVLAFAFRAALSILRGEDEEANERAGMAFLAEISETPWHEVTDAEKAHWTKRALRILRGAGGIGEGE